MGDEKQSEAVKEGKMEYELGSTAQLKVLLHAAKYPWADVDGVLLGTKDGKSKVKVTDAIPLFHTTIFTPMLETAMILTEEYCKSKQTPEGTQIVGWYHGSGRVNCSTIPPTVEKIANKIRSKDGSVGACVLIIENSKLSDESSPGVQLYVRKSQPTTWTASSQWKQADASAPKTFTSLLKANAQDKLADFDAWLEDTTLDWRNGSLLTSK